MTDLASILPRMFPTVDRRAGWTIRRDDKGEQFVSRWLVPGVPQPTIDEIAAWEPPIERRKVDKDLVEERMSEDGTLGAAMELLLKDPDKWRRWNARAYPWVYADDADTVAMIAFVGSDPVKILAKRAT